jgi:hypothetical protein
VYFVAVEVLGHEVGPIVPFPFLQSPIGWAGILSALVSDRYRLNANVFSDL